MNERGGSLVDLVMGMALAGLLMAGVATLYDTSLRTYALGLSMEEASSAGRATGDTLLRELQFAVAWAGSASGVFLETTPTRLVFLADLDGTETTLASAASAGTTRVTVASATGLTPGNSLLLQDGALVEVKPIFGVAGTTITLGTALTGAFPAGAFVRGLEQVTYAFSGGSLTKQVGTDPPLVLMDQLAALTLAYYDGSNPPVAVTGESQASRDRIRQVAARVTAKGTSTSQTAKSLQVTVRPRNLP